jgi:hypothetical protein
MTDEVISGAENVCGWDELKELQLFWFKERKTCMTFYSSL